MRRRQAARPLALAFTVTLSLAACGSDIDPDQALAEGLAQQQAGNLDLAAEQYQLVLDVRPDDKYANYNLGVMEQAGGRSALAEGYYRSALDTDPAFVSALFNLAILRTQAGATQEAIDLYLRVIDTQPEHAAGHFNVGILYRDSGKTIQADKHINEALSLDPSLADRLATDAIDPGSPSPGGSTTPAGSSPAP